MSSDILQGGRFADAQELRIQDVKRSNMGSAVQQWAWFADAQESRIQAAKRWETGNAVPQGVVLLMIRNRIFRLRIVQIWAVPPWKGFDLLMPRNRVYSLGNVHIWGVPSVKVVDLMMFRNCFSTYETFRYGHCRNARGWLADYQEWCFQASKSSDKSSVIQQEGRIAVVQE